MTFRAFDHDGTKIVELAAGGGTLESERDALDLISACMEHASDRLLIDGACLSEGFYRLRTGLAGAVAQKLGNYHVRAAVVVSPGASNQGKFKEFALETNRGGQFRLVETRDEALRWLAG